VPSDGNLSAWRTLLAGGIAGCISWASIFPLGKSRLNPVDVGLELNAPTADVIKTRVQSQPLLGSVLSSAIAPTLAVSPPVSPQQRSIVSPEPSSKVVGSALSRSYTSSSTTSTVSTAPVTTPAESTPLLSAQQQSCRRSTRQLTLSAYREGGTTVFFRGLGICSVRAFVVNAVQWAVYEWAMEALVKRQW
jgi:hypothetical protein